MDVTFTAPPLWLNEGAAPSEALKTGGFTTGYKPPADVFNYQFNKYGTCIKELQEAVENGIDADHTHQMSDIVGLETALSGKANATHTHAQSDITGLESALSGKANTAHAHSLSDITGLDTALSGKANATHTHAQSDITGLSTALGNKADKTHTHAEYEGKTGKDLTGKTVYPEYATISTVAGTGAEINNDYRERTYETNGNIKQGNVASGDYSHAEGVKTTANDVAAHAEGSLTVAIGFASHAEGQGSRASGNYSHAEGVNTTANVSGAHAEGENTAASGNYSHAEGSYTEALGFASHASGVYTRAYDIQFVTGKYNSATTGTSLDSQAEDETLYIVGNGTSSLNSNAFRITASGKCKGASSFSSSGADYAEYFEWKDGNENNEDRRGLFVTLDGDKIRLANATDNYIVGIISANPSVVGDVQSENWHGMYKKDVFGQPLTETVEVPESTDKKTGEVIPAHTTTRFVVNPDYDPDEEYKSREFRKEWACVGMLGKLIVTDDGTCEVNGYCKVADGGKATKADTGYRVMKRLDDTHIQILYR